LNLIRVIPAEGSESIGHNPALQAAFAAFFANGFSQGESVEVPGGQGMQILVNGEQRIVGPISVLGLLQELKIDPRRVAVELNMEILPKADYETTALRDGDRIEIVHFVGGG
jgi:sulfur carrier protein